MRNESMGSEVWTRDGIGSMNKAPRGSIRFLDEWAIWSSEGAPTKLRFNLGRAAQCAPNSRENGPYDPAHGAPELPEAAPALTQLPCCHAWGYGTDPNSVRMTISYTYIRPIHPRGNKLKARSSVWLYTADFHQLLPGRNPFNSELSGHWTVQKLKALLP